MPWARGPSHVLEVMLSTGDWTAFAAEKMPLEMDDALKAMRADICETMKNGSAECLLDCLPMAFPSD